MRSESDRSTGADIPYEQLAIDLVRRIRGRASQAGFSRRAGYDSNVVYTWESGRRSPTASRFFAAAMLTGLDVDGGTERFVRRSLPPLDSAAGVAALLAAVVGDQPIGAVAARAGVSRHQLGRWTRGIAEPRLPDLLRAIDGASLGVLDWLAQWVDPDDLRSVRHTWRSLRGARALARASPWASAVLLVLGLAEYQALPAHQPGWIAERLGIPLDLELGSLDVLCAAGLVHRSGDRYAPAPRPPVDVRGAEPRIDLKAFWSRVALDRLEAGAPGLHTWNLFSASAEAHARIEALQRRFYAEMRREVAESGPTERVALAVLHLVPLSR